MAEKNEKVNKNKNFGKEFKTELKKVTWPTPKQIVTSTAGVIIIAIIVAIVVFILDICFENINVYGVNKLKEMITVSEENSENSENEENKDDQLITNNDTNNGIEMKNTESESSDTNLENENTETENTENQPDVEKENEITENNESEQQENTEPANEA